MIYLTLFRKTFSYGEESSTKLYNRNAINDCHFADESLSTKIFYKLDKSFDPKRGPLVTCQAMLGETWEDIIEWSRQGYVGVEMETATFFAVSKHFSIPAGAILYISDNLIEKEIMFSQAHENAQERRNLVRAHNYKLAFEIILKSLS